MKFESEPLTMDDAVHLLDALDKIVEAIDQYVDGDSRDIHHYFWDEFGKAYDVLREYGLRPARRF